MRFDDNIIKGVQDWSTPYRFIIGRKSKWNSDVEVMLWTPLPALAYKAYRHVKDNAEDNINGSMYDYFLHDSFHQEAENFCRLAYENENL